MMINKLFSNPVFLIGLSIRVLFIFLFTPYAVSEWYIPFLNSSINNFSIDPWNFWLKEVNGSPNAFPYGYIMWFSFLPLVYISKLLMIPLHFGYSFTLLLADILLLIILGKLLKNHFKQLLIAYWLSPIIIFASYCFGFNDLISVLILILSIFYIKNLNFTLSGIILSFAISSKLSMIIAFPLFLIYFKNNRPLRKNFYQFFNGFIFGCLIVILPFLFSSSGIEMISKNPEIEKVYSLIINLGNSVTIYVVPIAYLITIYLTWRVKRLNFDLFQSITGLVFLQIVLLSPASAGWFVWCVPFLAIYQVTAHNISYLLIYLFSGTYLISNLLIQPLFLFNGKIIKIDERFDLNISIGGQIDQIIYTTMITFGCILLVRIWRESVNQNDFLRLSKKPFIIGVAGDSGSGKDTLSDAIISLFGKHSSMKLSGDDYHIWDRQKPIWQLITHLNPVANNLEDFGNDLVSLSDGKNIKSRYYDHTTGMMSKPFWTKSEDVIIASGLHALLLPTLREKYDLKIYLDIDEDLRQFFKIKRDVNDRGHSLKKVRETINKRKLDSLQFVKPQIKHADLIFALSIENKKDRNLENHNLNLKLIIQTKLGLSELSLHKVLVGICGLYVDISGSSNSGYTSVIISGDFSEENATVAAKILCPRVLEFLDRPPRWEKSMLGLMQLITLAHINQILIKRLL